MHYRFLRTLLASLLFTAPAAAQSAPELPSSIEFKRSLLEAALPPPADTQDKTPPATNLQTKPYGRMFRASEAFAWSGTAFDMTTTAKGIAAGGREVGVYRVVGDRNTTGILLMAGAWEVGATLLSRKLYKEGHPKLATIANFIRGGVHVGAGASNLHQLRKAQGR